MAVLALYINREYLSDANRQSVKNAAKSVKNQDVALQDEISKLKKINSDTVGIIEIPNTKIFYPVVKTKDNSYYLQHNIKKETDPNGAIFMDYENDVYKSDNLIIYGHNMLNRKMFSDLTKYKDRDFMEENRDIYLYVDDKKINYKVIGSMILSLDTGEKIFNFNAYTDFDEYYDAQDYFRDIKKAANNLLVDKVEDSDKFLTLSTCSYETDDSRFVLFAVKDN